jgi:hypothetical protein
VKKQEVGIDYYKVFKVCVLIMILCIAGWALLIHYGLHPKNETGS